MLERSILASRLLHRSSMPKLPRARQTKPSAVATKKRAADHRSLAHAFLTFTQAAGSLEKSYGQLQSEVGRLRADLECANTGIVPQSGRNVARTRLLGANSRRIALRRPGN